MPDLPPSAPAPRPPRRRRVPGARRFVAGALASAVAVFGVLALRVHAGDDPALGTAKAATGAATTTTATDTTTTGSTATSVDPYAAGTSSSDSSSSSSSSDQSSSSSTAAAAPTTRAS